MATLDLSNQKVRGTQSFVHTLSACWKRPSLTALEILWRWAFGIPAAVLIVSKAIALVQHAPLNFSALKRMTLLDPSTTAVTLDHAAAVLVKPALELAAWMGPLLMLAWVVVSSFGRTAVLRRVDRRLIARPSTLMALQAIRALALGASVAVWLACLRAAADLALNSPAKTGQEPNLVLYCALVIVITLGIFILWSLASWVVSIGPLLAMKHNLGPIESLAAALRLGPLRSKLIEVNLVMGIVKIALVVLAMVASACPLPFEAIATPSFMTIWYGIVMVVYFIASDFFHVVRLVSCLELWEALDEQSMFAAQVAIAPQTSRT